ncbi:hypothetical protein VTL71DRAFT_10783 [Oculimacula yallundae]|uniref:Uncharacterized protein n=1 Tax=Oculimacula yallundae TaxID=86028 RepID=A0ABR4CWK6_9HELO
MKLTQLLRTINRRPPPWSRSSRETRNFHRHDTALIALIAASVQGSPAPALDLSDNGIAPVPSIPWSGTCDVGSQSCVSGGAGVYVCDCDNNKLCRSDGAPCCHSSGVCNCRC